MQQTKPLAGEVAQVESAYYTSVRPRVQFPGPMCTKEGVVLVIPVLGRQRLADPLGLPTSQSSLHGDPRGQ